MLARSTTTTSICWEESVSLPRLVQIINRVPDIFFNLHTTARPSSKTNSRFSRRPITTDYYERDRPIVQLRIPSEPDHDSHYFISLTSRKIRNHLAIEQRIPSRIYDTKPTDNDKPTDNATTMKDDGDAMLPKVYCSSSLHLTYASLGFCEDDMVFFPWDPRVATSCCKCKHDCCDQCASRTSAWDSEYPIVCPVVKDGVKSILVSVGTVMLLFWCSFILIMSSRQRPQASHRIKNFQKKSNKRVRKKCHRNFTFVRFKQWIVFDL